LDRAFAGEMKNTLKRLELGKQISGAGRALHQYARPILRFLTDVTYPGNCVVCEDPMTGGVVVCEACLDVSERILPPFCQVCGESYTGEMTVFFQCSNCGDRKFDFDFVVSAWQFKGTIRTMLLGLKYGKKSFLRRTLADLMMPVFDDERLAATRDEAWKIVPVPLNSRKFREREFNQAAEIAAILSKKSGYPVLHPESGTAVAQGAHGEH
jgi:predicted amidophosphoribosyltransferase